MQTFNELPLVALALLLVCTAQAAPRPGQIVVDPADPAWFRYAGGGHHFLAGAGDPEDFLYRGTQREDGTRDGDQRALIDKLAASGANGIYLQAVRSHGGDGDETHNPFTGNDPARGLNAAVLDQWDEWFALLDAAGVGIYFFFYDDSARIWDTGTRVSEKERAFFVALVQRFKHLRHLVWVIAEEYSEAYLPARISRLAAVIRGADDHAHPIGVHKLAGLDFSEFADDPHIDQFTMQYFETGASALHRAVLHAHRAARGRYNINMAEAPGFGSGAAARRRAWAAAMGGAYVMVYQMDIAGTAEEDLRDLGRLARFMESALSSGMRPLDELAFGATDYVLADPGQSYIAYTSAADERPLGLRRLPAGDYRLTWLDTVTGERVVREAVTVAAGDRAWRAPPGLGGEIALHVERLRR